MRIIVATGLNAGVAEFKNMGDVAMLQSAVDCLLSCWPDAQVQVLTDSPADLALYCPHAKALSRSGCQCWVGDRILLGRLQDFLPDWGRYQFSLFRRFLGRKFPRLLESAIRLRLALWDREGRRENFLAFLEALRNAELLIVCGSGGFADSCQDWNLFVLGTMEAAIQHGVPVAMFGQGMGPLKDSVTISRAKEVLPKVTLISLRGTRGGEALLENLGVKSEKSPTTGDEAIEPAYRARETQPGSAIGVNLRVATYSGVSTPLLEQVGAVLQRFARERKIALVPVPITFHQYAPDHQAIQRLLAGFDNETDGGLSLDTPLKVIKQVARCRIVVTGAYHAAVFGLAQGIPAVCLSNSSYYLAKFQGLQDLFGAGCSVVSLNEADWPRKLAAAIDASWSSAESLRHHLLQSAVRQIENRRAGYQRLKDLLNSSQLMPVVSADSPALHPESHPCHES
jgi:polysaccharide pyruvyl transferase WcaK-like protein